MSNLKNNNAALEALIEQANALPIAITVDATLTQEGAAADAKATGDRIAALNEEIAGLPQSVVRYDEAQTLTEEEKALVRENIGVDVEIPNSNLVNGETTGSLQGIKCRAYYGDWAVALGYETEASQFGAFAAGHGAEAKGWGSVALGSHTIAEGWDSFAVGTVTKAHGSGSFAQGQYTDAYGYFSHVEGEYTIARGQAQHVQGKYNIEDNNNKYAHIVGNGYYDDDMEEYCRSNAHTLDWEGNGWFAGSVYVGGTGQDDTTASKLITQADMEAYVNEAILGGAW